MTIFQILQVNSVGISRTLTKRLCLAFSDTLSTCYDLQVYAAETALINSWSLQRTCRERNARNRRQSPCAIAVMVPVAAHANKEQIVRPELLAHPPMSKNSVTGTLLRVIGLCRLLLALC